MTPLQNNILGTLCMLFGLLLFLMVSGIWLFQLFVAIGAYYIIDYGLALRGLPPISHYIKRHFMGPGRF